MPPVVRNVAKLVKPLAIVQGAHESIVNPEHFSRISMPRCGAVPFNNVPDAGHAPHWESPEAFDALLAAFATDCYWISPPTTR